MENDRKMDEMTNERLNELYWTSSRTIDEIVEELGIGRNSLYALVEPLDAGSGCSVCPEQLVFTNRTNRAAGTALCISCGNEMVIVGSIIEGTVAGETDRPVHGQNGEDGSWTRWRDDLGSVAPERAALIGGAAALGMVVGAAAARALRH